VSSNKYLEATVLLNSRGEEIKSMNLRGESRPLSVKRSKKWLNKPIESDK
jgi:hypothetical protein